MSYILPTPTDWVTASWWEHINRNPPSSEPGTDYGASYGSPLYAVADGYISYVKTSNSGGGGRTVRLKPWSGQETQSLHNSEIWVSVGQHVTQGQVIGLTGASGYGDDWYYGPHNHQTLWSDVAWSGPTIDFEPYVGAPVPPIPGPTPGGDIVGTLIAARDSGGHVFYMEAGYVKHLASPAEVQALSWAFGNMPTGQFDDLDLQRVIWGLGLEEYSFDDVLDLSGRDGDRPGRFLVASWRDARK